MRSSGGNGNERTGRYFEFLGFFGDCSCLGLEDGMRDIQDEAYTELCLENEGLRKALSIAHAEYRKFDDKLEQALRRIEEMTMLITRVAEALEGLWYYDMSEQALNFALIAELRKA